MSTRTRFRFSYGIIDKMRKPDSQDHTQAHLTQDLLFALQSKTGTVLSAAEALLESGVIEDPADRQFVVDAVSFIRNPTENYSDIRNHAINIGNVAGGYEMQGADIPAAVDAMHAYLLTLQCINRMDFVEKELAGGSPDFTKIKEAMIWAEDPATHLSRGYKDDTLLTAVNELQGRLNNL